MRKGMAGFFCLLLAAAGFSSARAQPCQPCSGGPVYRPWVALKTGDLYYRLQLDLANPGARSLGMGGAFAGLADDSTAAFTNPAALTQVLRPELAFEVRSAASRADRVGSTTVELMPGAIVGTSGPREPASSEAAPAGIAYLAASYAGRRWAIAGFEHQLADLDRAGARVDISSTGASLGFRLTRSLSLGGTYLRYRGDALVEDEVFSAAGSAPAIVSKTRIGDHDGALSGGLFWRPGYRWSFSAYFRQGAALEVEQEVEVRAAGRVNRFAGAPLELPSVRGIGVGFRPNERLLLDFDWSRARHTRHLQDPAAASAAVPETERREVDELALGAEYSFWNLAVAPALRLGLSTQRNPLPPPPGITATPRNRLRVAAGAGLVIASHWQIDVAVQGLDRKDPALSFSTVVRF